MTSNGGGWTLITNRRGNATNDESCGSTLTEFFESQCDDVLNVDFNTSYNIGNTQIRTSLAKVGQWMFKHYDASLNLDSDDAFIIKNDGSDLFFPSVGVANSTLVNAVCDINNSNCDTTDVYFLWIGDGWFASSLCSNDIDSGTYKGNYGHCHNDVTPSSGYASNSLFGNREGYDETKLWLLPSSGQLFQEQIWVR